MYLYFSILIIPLLFLKFFVRKPLRQNLLKNKLVSPCDGTVTYVDDKNISIYLSIFNVHWQYIPINSKIKSIETIYGSNKLAILPKSSHNSGIKVIFESNLGDIAVTQRVGFFVKRISNSINVGDTVNQSDPYGIIRFGSRVDIILPDNVECILKIGNKVTGGITSLIK